MLLVLGVALARRLQSPFRADGFSTGGMQRELLSVYLLRALIGDRHDIVLIVLPSIWSHPALDATCTVLLTVDLHSQCCIIFLSSIVRVVAILLLGVPHLRHDEVLLESLHLPNEVLLQVYIFLLDLAQVSRVLDQVRTHSSHILALYRLVVLLVVVDALLLKLAEHALQIDHLLGLDFLFGEGLLWHVSVVKVHALVLVLHAQVAGDSGVCHDLFILLLV